MTVETNTDEMRAEIAMAYAKSRDFTGRPLLDLLDEGEGIFDTWFAQHEQELRAQVAQEIMGRANEIEPTARNSNPVYVAYLIAADIAKGPQQ